MCNYIHYKHAISLVLPLWGNSVCMLSFYNGFKIEDLKIINYILQTVQPSLKSRTTYCFILNFT